MYGHHEPQHINLVLELDKNKIVGFEERVKEEKLSA